MEILEIYKHMVNAWGGDVREDGIITQSYGGDPAVVTVGGKILRMPTNDFLRNPDWDTYICFHPLCEQAHRGDSEIFHRVMQYMTLRFNVVIDNLMIGLARLAADVDGHKNLNAKASAFLELMPTANKSTVKAVDDILDQVVGSSTTNTLLGLFCRRGGELYGTKYNRVLVCRYPLLSEIDDEKRKIFGVKLLVNDYQPVLALYRYVMGLGDGSDLEVHNYGTNAVVAPNLHALYGVYFNLAKHFNKLIKLYGKYIPGLTEIKLDTSWEEEALDMGKFRGVITPLDGNVGAEVETGPEVTAIPNAGKKGERSTRMAKMAEDNIVSVTQSNQTTLPFVPDPVPQPYAAPAVVQQPSAAGRSWSDTQNEIARAQYGAAPVAAVPAVQPIPVSTGGWSGNPFAPAQQPQQVVNSGGMRSIDMMQSYQTPQYNQFQQAPYNPFAGAI